MGWLRGPREQDLYGAGWASGPYLARPRPVNFNFYFLGAFAKRQPTGWGLPPRGPFRGSGSDSVLARWAGAAGTLETNQLQHTGSVYLGRSVVRSKPQSPHLGNGNEGVFLCHGVMWVFLGRLLSLHTIGLSFGTAHGGFRFLELLPAPCRCPVGKPPGHLVQSRPQHPLPRLLDFLRCLSTLHDCQMGAPWQLSALSGGFLACLTQVTFLKLLK